MTDETGRIIEGFAINFGKPDRNGDLITPDALKNFDLQLLRHGMVDLRFNQSDALGIVQEVERRDGGIYVRVRLAPGIVLPAEIPKCRIRSRGVIKKAHQEGGFNVVDEMEIHRFSIVGEDEAV